MNEWVQLAADHLVSQLPGTPKWEHRGKMNADDPRVLRGIRADMSALSQMPEHAQHLVLATVARRPSYQFPPYLHILLQLELDDMPTSLQARIIAAAVTPCKSLRTRLVDESMMFLDALHLIRNSPPHLLSLEVLDGSWSEHFRSQGANCLTKALLHHSGLTSLVLGAPCNSRRVLRKLGRVLSRLTSLQSLQLGTKEPLSRCPADVLPILRKTVNCMPRLESLSLVLNLGDKPKWDEDVLPDHYLAATLREITALTSLHILVHPPSFGYDDFLDARHLQLPHLSDLSIEVNRPAWATILLSHLSAPLTSLTIAAAIRPDCTKHYWHDAVTLEGVGAAVARFQQLRHLRTPDASNFMITWPSQALALMLTTATSHRTVLQQLHTLAITVNATELQVASPSLASAMPGLRSLSLCVQSISVTSTISITPEQWAGICTHISRLQLQELALYLYGHGPRLSDLSPLMCLTYLLISGTRMLGYSGFPWGACDIPALAEMTQLKCLVLETTKLDPEHLNYLMPRLAAFPVLTALFIGWQDPSAMVAAFPSHGRVAPWPMLRRLGFGLDAFTGSNGSTDVARACVLLARAACSLPALQHLSVALRVQCRGYMSGNGESVDEALLEPPHLEQYLWRSAARAGVSMSFKAGQGIDLEALWTRGIA